MATADCYGCGKTPGSTEGCSDCAKMRELHATAIGGARALKTFTEDRFKASDITYDAWIAAKSFDPRKDNLYLCGPCGTGKSHLAAVAARPQLPHVVTVNPLELVAAVMGASRSGEDREAVRRYAHMRVLVLDDIGVGTYTERTVDRIYDVIQRRYMDRAGGLIVTSNLTLDGLAEYLKDDRITSRLAQLCRVFNFAGEPDHRLEKRP